MAQRNTGLIARATKAKKSRSIKREGWILKQGPPPWKGWKKRYLVLEEEGLQIFKKPKQQLCVNIPLTCVSSIESDNEQRKKFVIKLVTPARTHIFAFTEEKEHKKWLRSLQHAKDENKQGTLRRVKRHAESDQPHSAVNSLEGLFVQPTKEELSKKEESEKSAWTWAGERRSADSPIVIGKTSSAERHRTKPHDEKARKPSRKSSKKSKEKKKKKSYKQDSEEEMGESGTLVVTSSGANSGEYRKHLQSNSSDYGWPTVAELGKMQKSELREWDRRLDIELPKKINAIQEQCVQNSYTIIDILIEKETNVIMEKFANERNGILAEMKQRGCAQK